MNHTQKAIALFILLTATVLALFAQIEPIGIGNAPNDGLGDTLRGAMIKINTNFTYLTNRLSTNIWFATNAIFAEARIVATSPTTAMWETNYFISRPSQNGTLSVSIGYGAGAGAFTNNSDGVYIGRQAGSGIDSLGNGIIIGDWAVTNLLSDTVSGIYIGKFAAGAASNSLVNSTIVGNAASQYSGNSSGNTLIGDGVGKFMNNITSSVIIGQNLAGASASNASRAIFIGDGAGRTARDAHRSIFIGENSGRSALSEYSVFLGANAGRTITKSNALAIHSSSSDIGSNSLIYGEFDNRLLRVNGNLEFTNGLYSYVAGSIQPLHPFASLMLVGDENLNLASSGTYYQITNYDAMVNNVFTGVATNGVLTNTIAGYYKVSTTCSFDGSGGVNDLFECAVFTNTVECPLIEWHRKTGSQDTGSAGATGIIYLPANTRVDARIQNTAASGTITLRHFNLTVTTP